MLNGTNGPRQLSPELVSLVHHIELNKAGWWDLAMQRLLLTALWLKQDRIALSASDLAATVTNELNIPLAEAMLSKHLQALTEGGQVLVLPDGRYKLSEQTVRESRSSIGRRAIAEQQAATVTREPEG